MKLAELLPNLTRAERDALAAAAGTAPVYLSQIAKGLRSPSPKLARRLVDCEPRLRLSDLRPDIWPAEREAA
jgi:transcriptional regulator with XRE-family HTH domain